MDQEKFSQKVHELRSQLEALVKQRETNLLSSAEELFSGETLENLFISLEELQVADEELRQQNNELEAARWLVRDISARKREQAELMESEARFRMLAESISAAILIVQDGKILYVNPAASDVTGYSTAELLGREFTEIIQLPFQETFREFSARKKVKSLTTRQPEEQAAFSASNRCEIQLIAKSGRDCWVDITLGDFQFEGRPALVVTAYDITEREKAKRDRQELLRQLVTIQEEESRRISRELHDHMGQSLTALILGIKSVEDMLPSTSPARRSLQQLKEIADELGREVHRLAFELRPAALDDLGLHTTLMNYAEEWAERTKIRVDYQATGLKEERFASPIETTIYRIVQEALTNIVKHANASNVSILLDRQPKLIQAIVEDDGCGLEPDEVFKVKGERRFGLIGMKERAELAGGTFHIESEAKKGTTIFVRIPLEI